MIIIYALIEYHKYYSLIILKLMTMAQVHLDNRPIWDPAKIIFLPLGEAFMTSKSKL